MKIFLIIIFLLSQSLVFGTSSSSSVDVNAEYLKALKLEPNHIGALEYLGELYYETGRIDEASELLERLKLVAGESSEEYLELFRNY